MVGLSNTKGYSGEFLLEESYVKFGKTVTGALEDNIEHSNIHGWLQERIFSVEKRLAYIITELLKNDIVKTEEIALIFNQNGAATMKESGVTADKPLELFTFIFDHMLEGMPCDRVNEIIENTEDVITWKTTRCLHKDHWDEVGGDIDNFYFFRDNWIDGFLSTSGTGYKYSRVADGISIIRRV